MASEAQEVLPEDTVLILGGGPVGMMSATVLAFYGVKSVVLERNLTTTNVDKYREMISARNDGTMPLEPWQRISQEIFEAWLKELAEGHPLIDIRFGWKLESILETDLGVEAVVTDLNNSKTVKFKSRYAVGCDGASSRVRRSLNIPLEGGPVPGFVLLVHFKSNDLARIHKQGRFWHLFMVRDGVMGGAAISQDEKDTFTTHLFLPMDTDESKISTEEAVYKVFGGMYEPFEVKIDKVLVRSTYRPSIAVAHEYSSPNGWIYLAGDSAHQNIPTGGYGMNMGLGDAYDIGWKLAAVIQGWAGKGMLQSYGPERRPVALINVERSSVHLAVHSAVPKILGEHAHELDANSTKGRQLRTAIHEHYQANDGENTDLGIEMGYRYNSNIIVPEKNEVEPKWTAHDYYPTTWPGIRPPHIFLKNGSALFDHFGKYFNLVHFIDPKKEGNHAEFFDEAATALEIPLKVLGLQDEDHARSLWERDMVLIRPDGHVSWRGNSVDYRSTAYYVLEVAAGLRISTNGALDGQIAVSGPPPNETKGTHGYYSNNDPTDFTSTEGLTSQGSESKLEKMGHFQE
ncbi:hypothetical protein LTR67_011225 [Exophiala xenobiotica]